MPHPGLIIAAVGGAFAWAFGQQGDDPTMMDPTMTDALGQVRRDSHDDDRYGPAAPDRAAPDRAAPPARRATHAPAHPFAPKSASKAAPKDRSRQIPGTTALPRIPVAAPSAPPPSAAPKLPSGAIIDPTRCPGSKEWPDPACQNADNWRSHSGQGGSSQFNRSYFGKEPIMSIGSTHYSHLGGVARFGRRPSTVILPGGREMFMDDPKEKKKGKVVVNVSLKKGGWKRMEQRAAKRAVKVLEAEGYDVDRIILTTLVIIPATPIGPVPFLYKGWAVARVVAKATYYKD